MSSDSPLHRTKPGPLAEQAAVWLVQLSGDDPAACLRAEREFAVWKAADPRHAAAAACLESVVERVKTVRQGAVGTPRTARVALDAVLDRPSRPRRSDRRRVASVLALVLAMAVPAWVAVTDGSAADLLADVRSSETDWIGRTLPDGTRIVLSGRAAIDVHYDARQRTVRLLHGDIRVEVAKDAERPFFVETPLARIRALGTRFSVSHERGSTALEMFESSVSVQALEGPQEQTAVVHAGERVRLTAQGLGQIGNLDAAQVERGWRHKQLVLNDRPLAEVLAQLARHRPGGIRFEPGQFDGLRVSAVLPLDRPDDALQLLASSLPELRVRSVAGRWVWVDRAPEEASR